MLMVFMVVQSVFAEDVCVPIEDGQLCMYEDGRIFLSPQVFDLEYNESLIGPFAPSQPDPQIYTINGSVETFNEDINIDSTTRENYTIYALTNFRDSSNRIHDLLTSVKNQGFGDCAKFASTALVEIEATRLNLNAFQAAKDIVTANSGDIYDVEINLSEAFMQEVNGCKANGSAIARTIASRGVIKEEHYPYFHRGFSKEKYYSKRDTERYEDFMDIGSTYGCTEDPDPDNSWNYMLFDKAVNEGWLVLRPKGSAWIEGADIDTVKNYINDGKPLYMAFKEGSLKTEAVNYVNNNAWGKFYKLKISSLRNQPTGAHGVVVVGYMVPTDGTGIEYLLFKNSWGFDGEIETLPINQMVGTDNALEEYARPYYRVYDDIEVMVNNTVLTSQEVADLDRDDDDIPDLFDNYTFTDFYNSYSSLNSFNPLQNEIDNDYEGFETDSCPYVEDEKKINMDMNTAGDFCDRDIDGDGLNNEVEGLSYDYLHKFVQNNTPLTESDYAALNPFINGENGYVFNNYLIPACFAGVPDDCGGSCSVGSAYISNLCFYNSHLKDSSAGRTGSYKFFTAGEASHGWYKAMSSSAYWTREYEYIENDSAVTSSGIKWNIPGYFEMENVSWDYYVASNYGENWPENYYNCLLHCKMLQATYNLTTYGFLIDLNVCESACNSSYNCNENIDSDCDGIRNDIDNCPHIENIDQADADGDKVGDVCDNCQNDPNGWEANNSEIVVAPCDNDVGGAYCLDLTKDHVYRDVNGDYHWQPDHDLDGEGDACDGGQIWAAFPNMPLNKSFSNVVVDNPVFTQYNIFPTTSISVDLEILSAGISVPLSLRATTRFCWLTPDQYDDNFWGKLGFCTTEAEINDNCIVDFGYSHGSDPKPWLLNKATWKEPTLSGQKEFTQITTNQSETVTWSWRQDFAKDNNDYEGALLNAPLCDEYDIVTGSCINSSENILSFYYTLSTGVKGFDDNYLVAQPDPEGGNENVNSGYFRNTQRYIRSQRLKTDPVPISHFYYEKTVAHDLGHEYCLGAPCNFPIDELRREFFQETIRDLVTGPDIFERTGMDHFFKNEFGSDILSGSAVLSEWNINSSGASSVKTSARPQYLATVAKNNVGFNIGLEAVPTGMQFMGYFPESTQNVTYNLVKMTPGSNGDWRTVGVLSNLPDYFNPVNSVYHNGDLFVISKEVTNAAILKKIYVINPVSLNGNTCTGSNNIYEPVFIDDLPDISNASLYSFTGGLYIIGEGGNGMEVHKLAQQSGDYYTVNITGLAMPTLRDTYTATVRDNVLYLAGGAAVNGDDIDFKTDIWKFTETDGWTMIRNDLNLFPASFRIDFDGDDIVLANRIVKSNSTTEIVRFNVDGSGDTPVPETIEVEGAVPLSVNDSYCLNETDNILKGGLDASGECVPFTHKWYNSFSAGATVYSVAGKGGRLYVGTDGMINVYDISDSASMTYVAEYSTGGERVYDLEVAGSEMYAATSGGIYRFDISDPDIITLINSLSTGYYNYQYRIQLYNDLLYVGDDNGINIRDKETFARISYVNDGAMLDFTISDGNIALYSSALFSSNVQVRDADSLNLVAWEYADCYTGELTSDHGEFYLSCDGYDYRFEIGSGTYLNFYTLDADILEMQENHVNNGFVYIPDGSSIKLSTNNDVPSLCGNGIIEPGEICDGDSVACTDLNAAYYGGTAYCNSTCDGYDEGSCETDDGW